MLLIYLVNMLLLAVESLASVVDVGVFACVYQIPGTPGGRVSAFAGKGYRRMWKKSYFGKVVCICR